MFKYIGVLLSLFVLVGCSSIIDGHSQEITVNTDPEGANCNLMRHEENLGSINPTPGSLVVEKTKYDITVTCSKEGYETTNYLNHSGIAGATFGNIILGGFIGWGIDSSTGADNKYDSPIVITLPKNASQ